MQVTPHVLIVAAMVTLLFMVPVLGIFASTAVLVEVSAETRIVFILVTAAWAAFMRKMIG